MEDHIKCFFEHLDAGEYMGWDLQAASEDTAALIVMNLMVEHGICPLYVLRELRGGGLEQQDDDVRLLADFRDKSRREEFIKAVQAAAPLPPHWWSDRKNRKK